MSLHPASRHRLTAEVSPWVFILCTLLIVSSPPRAQPAETDRLAGWWGYDDTCPASDDGFSLQPNGRASDGSGTYTGRWSLKGDQVSIVWDANEAEREHLKPDAWHIVERYRLVREPAGLARLVNVDNKQTAWFCRPWQ